MRRLVPAAALLAVAAAPVIARAQQPDPKIAAAVDRFAPQVIAARHVIHQNPELGNREVKTAELIAKHLRELGLEVRTNVAKTGVVATLKGGRPGPLVAVRADIDALPVTEQVDLPFKSTVRTQYNGQEVGVMHACGHDIHVAVQLGVASVLASMKNELPGTVQFIFQPAEEGAPVGEEGGAALMLKEGMWKAQKPSAVFGLHVDASMPVGWVSAMPGPIMASSDSWTAKVTGRQSHGAYPHNSIDPVVMASQVVLALQTIVSRSVDPQQPAVVTVGIIRGGTRMNIIPADVTMEGTVRTFDPKVQDLIEKRMNEVFDGITKAGGGSFALDYRRGYPVTVNDPNLVAKMRTTFERAAGASNVKPKPPVMGAEDFSFFARETPGYFFQLGGVAPGTTSGDHHTPTFRVDDSAIPVGMRVMTSLLLDYLKTGPVKVAER
jgi:amidohydrolase